MDLSDVVTVKIHPAIGIARIGNSEEYFVGPELPYPTAAPSGGYKDERGRLKRQAARFRVYGYDANDKALGEITAEDAEITWRVHVANKKSAWYDFRFALDLFPPDTPTQMAEVVARRNGSITGADREKLVIDPGPRSVGGVNAAPERFDTGAFFGTPVDLGEVRTDEAGRLLFVGGRGVSASVYGPELPITFANNAGWHDDTSDGPVHATVRLGDRTIEADGAWVVTAPPNYAPDIVSPQTMWDLVFDTNVGWWFAPPAKTSFTEHVLPLLRQLSDTQWVNYGFLVMFGWRSPHDFSDKTLLAKLAQPPAHDGTDPYRELRTQIAYQFRQKTDQPQPLAWPPIYGDASGSFDDSPRAYFTYTPTNLKYIDDWRKGDFVGDYDPDRAEPGTLEEVEPARQPCTLDRAALYWCMGGPFHPGCELTWPMRQPMPYRSALRLRERPAELAEPDYGEFMTAALATSDDGPLASSGPGDLTKWMAVPWQTDTASCRSGYPTETYPDGWLPTFWPSRVPNDVLAEEDYAIVIDASRPLEERIAAFNRRGKWLARILDLDGPYIKEIGKMIDHFGDLGVVEARENPHPDDPFPSTIYVESAPTKPVEPKLLQQRLAPRARTVSEDFMRARFGGRARLGAHPPGTRRGGA